MDTSAIMQTFKKASIVLGLAAAIFAGYSVIGYVTETLVSADATVACGSATCGMLVNWIEPGEVYNNTYGGGGGGGGYQTPACSLTVAADYGVYLLGWTSINATSISINNGIGSVTPVASGSKSVFPSQTTTYTATVTNAAGVTANCSTTITVTPPPTPPICTLDLTKDQITWTTSYAYQVLIKPLTNSPEVPGLVPAGPPSIVQHTETEAYESLAVKQDIALYGINTTTQLMTGFHGDQMTMNRVCALIDGAGSTATGFYSEGYYTPNGNYVMLWTGSAWSRVPAINPGMNNHLRYNFTCSKPGGYSTYPLSGSNNFVPPLGYGTHTYQLTATGAGGNVQCEKTITLTPPPTPKECKLSIVKTSNKTTAAAGDIIEYTIEFKNIGDKDCSGSGVKVLDLLDPMLVYQSETHSSNVIPGYLSQPVYKDRLVTFNADTLTPGETGWFKIKVKAGTPTSCSVVVPNYAQISSVEYDNFNSWVSTQPVLNVTITKDCTPPPPTDCKMEITKSADKTSAAVGDTVEFSVNFKNVGTKNCTGGGVKVQDTLDQIFAYQSETHSSNISGGYGGDPVYKSADRTVRFNADTLTPGEAGWFKVKVTVGTPTSCEEDHTNKAKITSYEYNNFQTWVESNMVSVNVTKNCQPPTECKLTIQKSANKTTAGAGDEVEYTISFKNIGTANCTGGGVKVQDTLDAGLTYKSETHSTNITGGYGGDPVYKTADRTIRFNADTLTPGEEGWFKVKVTAATPASCSVTVPNKAKITSYEYNNFQTWVESNIVSLVVTKDCNPPVEKECKLIIEKDVNKTTVTAGDEVEYTISFKNIGTANCTGGGVKVVDVVDLGLTYKSETHSTNVTGGYGGDPVYKSSDHTLRWNADTLTPNETGWVKWKAKINTPSACTTTIPNTAKITAYELNNFKTWVESNTVTVTATKDCETKTPFCTLSAEPATLTAPGSTTLTWTSQNITSVLFNQGIGSVALNGSVQVAATTTTEYIGTFSGPYGAVICKTPVTVTPPGPACTLTVSKSRIKPGESVIVSWTSSNVVTLFINGNIGTSTPVSVGQVEVFPSDDITYIGTFKGTNGQTLTCSAPVTLDKGGGGCSGNCGGGLNPPNVVLLNKPGDAPLAFVTLSQIPYTGFQAGVALTIIFWAAVGLLAALFAYFVMGRGGMQYFLGGALEFVGVSTKNYDDYEYSRALPSQEQVPYTHRDSAANGYHASTMTAPQAVVGVPTSESVGDGIPDLAEVIETRANAAGVLMSPESVQKATTLSADRGVALRLFGDILNKALQTIPREDGWVLLTSERFEDLASVTPKVAPVATITTTPSVESILASVMTPPVAPAPVHRNVEMPMDNADDQAVVIHLARAILSGNRDHAYTTARTLETNGANAASVMTIIATALDQLARARRVGSTTDLSEVGARVSDATLTKMVEIFTHALDHSYTNAYTSLKLAIAQAFEARG